MLERGDSINLYMFAGGTSFGWMNGANSNGANADRTTTKNANYEPDVTSYDYDVPVSEAGVLQPKFFAFRKVIQTVTGEILPEPPPAPKVVSIGPLTLTEDASLWKNLPRPVHDTGPRTMEALGQSYGYVLYRTMLSRRSFTGERELKLPIVHDYAMVYVDGTFQGAVDRRLNQTTLTLHALKPNAQLDILVENTGRVNYGKALNGERVGLLSNPTLDGEELKGWDSFPLPMATPKKLSSSATPCVGPCFYRTTFTVDKPEDTYLDTSNLSKGFIWINGIPLGRFWSVGPQKTLYLPGPWLHAGQNELQIFELAGKGSPTITGTATQVLDAPPTEDPLSSGSH